MANNTVIIEHMKEQDVKAKLREMQRHRDRGLMCEEESKDRRLIKSYLTSSIQKGNRYLITSK